MSETESDFARRIAAGTARSPTRTPEFTWFAMRWSGTAADGTAWRDALNEHVHRAPEITLSPEMCDRLAGLPLMWLHPPKGVLDSTAFEQSVIGTLAFGYVAGPDGIQNDSGSELWCLARCYNADAMTALCSGELSTSPAVSFLPDDGNETIHMQDGTHLLIEGRPAALSHLAVVPAGVWDRGSGPSGIRLDNTKEITMPEETPEAKKAREDADNKLIDRIDAMISKQLGDVRTRLDSLETPDRDNQNAGAMADAARRDAERAEWMKEDAAQCARDDAEEAAEVARQTSAGELPGVAADKARKGRRDRMDKRRADAGRSRSSADAEAERKNEGQRADAQARADAAATGFGERAPPPMSGELSFDYRKRLLRRFQQYSPSFKNADLHTIADVATFAGVESVIYADAVKASSSPEVLNAYMSQRKRTNESGHQITEFFGPETVFKRFSAPVMAITQFNIPNRGAR